MTAPLVSILIPVYNGADFLREAIDSALAQTYPCCEVLVVNDGSRDSGATESIALSYGGRIRYFAKQNGGVASALNLGIEHMRGEFFSWLSHDDVYLPDKCRAQAAFWRQCGDPRTVVYSDLDCINAGGHRTRGKAMPDIVPSEALYRIWGESFLNGCTMLIPRKLLLEAGGFRHGLPTTQDYDLWLRLARLAVFRHLPQVVLLSRQHSGQGSRLRAHRKECAELFSAHIPALVEYARKQQGGFESAAPVLADGLTRRVVDYGLPCAKGMWRAFGRYLTPEERRILIPWLLRRLPRASLRWAWLRLPEAGRSSLRSFAQPLRTAWQRFRFALKEGGLYSAVVKTCRYGRRIAGRARRTLRAAPVQSGGPERGADRPLAVIVDHDSGGGVLAFREHFAARHMAEGADILIWQYLGGVGYYLFELRTPGRRCFYRSRTLRGALAFVSAAAPDTLVFNNMAGWPDIARTLEALPTLCRNGGVEVFLHDYFALCPAYPLLDRRGAFCGVPVPPAPCRQCLPGHPLAAPHDGMAIVAWREMWGRFLSRAAGISAADSSVKDLFSRVYPHVARNIRVAPLDPLINWKPLPLLPAGMPAVVGIIGHITRHKGAGIVEDLIRLVEEQGAGLRFVVIGSLESALRSPLLRVTGTYEHARLPELLGEHGVSVCLVPSPLPETFCYVAQEIEMLGLPLICLDLGAQGTRARRYAKGFPASTPDAEGCLRAILRACESAP